MSFNSLGLSDALLKAISKKGYTTPSPIQQKAIKPILEGKDVLASAQTGTGKTAAFTLPILQIISQGQQLRQRPIRALILTPTRELAAQIFENIKEYSTFLDIRSTVIFGGVNQNPQAAQLRNGVDILVATPGRLIDLQNQGLVSLAKVEILKRHRTHLKSIARQKTKLIIFGNIFPRYQEISDGNSAQSRSGRSNTRKYYRRSNRSKNISCCQREKNRISY